MPRRFRVAPGRLRSVALAALTLLASTEAFAQAMGEWGSGERVYRGICRYCHDTGVGPVIKGRGLDPAYVAARVRYGFRAMPAFRPGTLGDEDLSAVARYVSAAGN